MENLIQKSEVTNTRRVLLSEYYDNVVPTGLGFSNAVTLIFTDTDMITDGGELLIHSNGELEVLDSKFQYIIKASGETGRSTVNGRATLVVWVEITTDGGNTWIQAPTTSTLAFIMSDNNNINRDRVSFDIPKDTPRGNKYRFRVGRLETGANDGGFYTSTLSETSFSMLKDVPSLSLEIYQYYNGSTV